MKMRAIVRGAQRQQHEVSGPEPGRHFRCRLTWPGLASSQLPGWHPFLIVLMSVFLAPESARSLTINGPSAFTSTIVVGTSTSTYIFNPGNAQITVTTSANNTPGVVVQGNGQFTVLPPSPGSSNHFGTVITTTGIGSYGISDQAAGHTVELNGVLVTTSGQNAHGIIFQNPNTRMAATNVTVTTGGSGASAVYMGASGSMASFTDSTLESEGGAVISALGGTIGLTGTTVLAGTDGRWLNVLSGSAVTINASAATLDGAAITNSGGLSALTLTNGTTWNMTGSSNVTTLTNNASQIVFAPGGAFKALMMGTYTGVNGTIRLNTFLGADGSPSDQLVINGGTATGNTLLHVANAGGPGARTMGNGIAVVTTIGSGTATASGAFALAGEVRGGAFTYFLFRGGLNGSNPQDWFLRTSFEVPSENGNGNGNGGNGNGNGNGNGGNGGNGNGGNGNGGNGNGGNGNGGIGNGGNGNGNGNGTGTEVEEQIIGLEPPPDHLPPGQWPIIGPELATYGVVQPMARQLGLEMLGTMHERIGDTLTDAGGGNSANANGLSRSAWARVFGQQVDNRYQTFTDARAAGSVVGVQAGLDLWRGSFLPGHHDASGVYFAYGNANVDVDGLVTNGQATGYVLNHTGSVNLNAYSGGVYWTHYGPSGWYVDAILQGTYYDGEATTQFARLPVSGSGIVTSLEAGYPFHLPLGPNFVLEPQAQLIWQHVGINDANDGLGPVDPGSTSGVTGRLGVRGQWTIERGNGQVWQPYVRANIWRDWGARATTTYAGTEQVLLAQQFTRMDVAAGVTAKLDTRWSLYGQFGYQFSINASATGSQKGVWGDVGFRYKW
ncbi:autotransporter family protein [Paraburkholderia atlantica]|uniref:autotransporter family protein n=1 Tax=Paraburkholderia atlantica TaxID=2654982 RepID=UPI00160F77C7